jgi:hypothetical protein
MTITIPIFGLILYLGKHGKSRKRENVSTEEIKRDIRYVIQKILGISMIFAAIIFIGIILVSFLMYNKVILNLEYIIGIIAVLRFYNTYNYIHF